MSWRSTILTATCFLVLAASACRSGPPGPATLDTRNEKCASCRMMVSSRVFASQIAAPGEEPRFFDDLGCLATWLEKNPLPKDAVLYVADHRTSEWVNADHAVFSRVDTLDTPMGSHIVAYADEASRAQDGTARGGTMLTRAEALGRAGAQ
jgi:copper chaperone NosL